MKLEKNFIEILASKKGGVVGKIIEDMNFLEFKNTGHGKSIQNIARGYKRLEQIYYTVWFLEKENFVTVDSKFVGSGAPDFNPEDFYNLNIKKDEYMMSNMSFINDMNKLNWGKEIRILPSFYDFYDNKCRTEKQITNFRNLWIPILVAVLTAFLTALFSVIFTGNKILFLLKII